jgi:hypothetical protein
MINYNKTRLVLFFLLLSYNLVAQKSIPLVDGRESEECSSCKDLINQKPKEVLYGIHLNDNGDVYFSMNNIEWFKKIFQNDEYGITVDLINADRYDCNKPLKVEPTVWQGITLLPLYRKDLLAKNESSSKDLYVKIGSVPLSIKKKTLEGNLVILNRNKICFYTDFVSINRNGWNLLRMGLFADSLIHTNQLLGDSLENFTYSKKTEIVIPFKKGTSSYSTGDLKMAYDSLDFSRYQIQKVEIRAYSSVEGTQEVNMELMKKRGDAMIEFLRPYQSTIKRSSVLAAENWLEFFSDIKETEFDYLKGLSKTEIKKRLAEPLLARKIEPLLARERKAVAVLYLASKAPQSLLDNSSIAESFKRVIKNKKLTEARIIQKEVIERIADNKLPVEYLDKLEVPQTKDFSLILNDREVYKYFFKITTQDEALSNFLRLKKLDSNNGQINYNICALKLGIWQLGYDSLLHSTLLREIELLQKQGIHRSLVRRMLINHCILKSEDFLLSFNYQAKDSTMEEIRDVYDMIETTDEEVYSLAKYYSYYSHYDWALEIVSPRIDKIDADEDLVFYYLNLLFYHPSEYESESFSKASLNAINLNKKRYCKFFSPRHEGGASMQLLEHKSLRDSWCQHCQ